MKQIYKDSGFLKLIKEIIKKIIRELGLYPYIINIYELDLENNFATPNKDFSEEFSIKTINKIKEIGTNLLIKLKNMNNEPIEKYLENGGQVDVVFDKQNEAVAYGCAQILKHDLPWGTILLKETQVWIGPAFVVKDFRGKGIHSGMRYHTLKRLKNAGFKIVLTAVDSDNIPSLKTLSKLKFEKVAIVKIKKFLGERINCEIKSDFNELSIVKRWNP